MSNKCIFCEQFGERFRVHDGVTYWLCDSDYYQHPYGDIVTYHNKTKLKKPKHRRKKIKRQPVEMILHKE